MDSLRGDRTVAVGRDVINSIINTGDHTVFFVGDYERLRDVYLQPTSIFDRVNLGHFVGREWLLAEVDEFLANHDRGYLILEAKAGLGKTTFLAWLVRERGYIHHFSELAPGLDGVGSSTRSLAAQLILSFHLNASEADGVLPGAATRPDFFYELLKQAAAKRREGEKLVIVVDALDESAAPPNQNVLGLPQVLPEGVFIVVSQRPVPVALQVDTATTPRHVLELSAESLENRADMALFLRAASVWPGISRALRESACPEEEFVRVLSDKCRGVWIYLRYVVQEIERGERAPLDLGKLPNGMIQYYTRYWINWRNQHPADWDRLHLPLLAVLTVTQEAITLERLVAWAVPTSTLLDVGRLLSERWRPFLTVAGQGAHTVYRFYHATLRELFSGEADRTDLESAELAFIDEVAHITGSFHARLAKRFIDGWGGLDTQLQGLGTGMQSSDNDYAISHLCTHLVAAERIEDLHGLLRLERRIDGSRLENVWYLAKGDSVDAAGYLTDITRGLGLSESAFEDKDGPERATSIGREIFYALVASSLNSLAQNVSPSLLSELVGSGVWTINHGLTYARQIMDRALKAQALVEIALLSSGADEQKSIWQEASDVARDDAVKFLAGRLLELGHVDSAIATARRIPDNGATLQSFAELLQEQGLFTHAAQAAASMRDVYSRRDPLNSLAIACEDQDPTLARDLLDELTDRERVDLLERWNDTGHLVLAAAAARAMSTSVLESRIDLEKLVCPLPMEIVDIVVPDFHGEYASKPKEIKRELVRALSFRRRKPGPLALDDMKELIGDYLREPYTPKHELLADVAVILAHMADLEFAFTMASAIRDERVKAAVLAEVIRLAANPDRARFLARAMETCKLASKPDREDVLSRAIDEVLQVDRASAGMTGLRYLAEMLVAIIGIEEGIDAVRAIQDVDIRACALMAIARNPRASGQCGLLHDEVFQLLLTTGGIAAMASFPLLLERLVALKGPDHVLASAQAIADPASRSRSLGALVPMLPESARAMVLREAVDAAWSIKEGRAQARVLGELTPLLAQQGQQGQAIDAANSSLTPAHSVRALAALLPLLPRMAKTLREKAVALLKTIPTNEAKGRAAAEFACRWLDAERPELDAFYRETRGHLGDGTNGDEAFAAFALCFAELGMPEAAFRACRELNGAEHESAYNDFGANARSLVHRVALILVDHDQARWVMEAASTIAKCKGDASKAEQITRLSWDLAARGHFDMAHALLSQPQLIPKKFKLRALLSLAVRVKGQERELLVKEVMQVSRWSLRVDGSLGLQLAWLGYSEEALRRERSLLVLTRFSSLPLKLSQSCARFVLKLSMLGRHREALMATKEMRPIWLRDRTLAQLAVLFLHEGSAEPDLAKSAAEAIRDPAIRKRLVEASNHASIGGVRVRPFSTTDAPKTNGWKHQADGENSRPRSTVAELRTQLAATRTIKDSEVLELTSAMCTLRLSHARDRRHFEIALSKLDQTRSQRTLRVLVLELVELGEIDEVVRLVQVKGLFDHKSHLEQLLLKLERSGQVPAALRVIGALQIEHDWAREQAFGNVAHFLSRKYPALAREAALAIKGSRGRLQCLMDIATLVPRHEREATLRVAVDTARTENDWEKRELAYELVKRGYASLALDVATGIVEADQRATTLLDLHSSLSGTERLTALRAALKACGEISHKETRSAALLKLLPHLRLIWAEVPIRNTLKLVYEGALLDNISSLLDVLTLLSGDDRQEALDESLWRIRLISDTSERAQLLGRLASLRDDSERSKLLTEATDSARLIPDEAKRQAALTALEIFRHKSDTTPSDAGFPLPPQSPLGSSGASISVGKRVAASAVTSEEQSAAARDEATVLRCRELAHEGETLLALEAEQTIGDPILRLHVLLDLFRLIPETAQAPLVTEVRSIFKGGFLERASATQLYSLCMRIVDMGAYESETFLLEIHSAWCQWLRLLARGTRVQLLEELQAAVPIVVALGGARSLQEAISSIQAIGRWWP